MLNRSLFRANPDGSASAESLTLVIYLALIASACALRRIRYRPARAALWTWIVVGLFGALFGTLVVLIKWFQA